MSKIFKLLRSFSPAAPAAEVRAPEPANVKSILLVGEDLAWLDGLKELAGRRVVLARPSTNVQDLLAAKPFDVIVASCADANESIALLTSAAMISPATLGLLRANRKEMDSATVLFPVLPRQDSAEILDDQLRTQLAAAVWQANPAYAELQKKIVRVPTLPSIYLQITHALQSTETSIEDIADLVAREPGVSVRLLQLVNSPMLALRGRVTSVRDATSLLGLGRLRSLVLATCLFQQVDTAKCRNFSMSKFEETSLSIAARAAAIAKFEGCDKAMVEMAFTAGLLHNFGELLLAANLPEAYDQVLLKAKEQRVSIASMELQAFGATDTEVAGTILASWGIPFPIVNAVGWRTVPSASEDTSFTPLTAVHAAVSMETFFACGVHTFDRTYMERLRLGKKMENWCASLNRESQAA